MSKKLFFYFLLNVIIHLIWFFYSFIFLSSLSILFPRLSRCISLALSPLPPSLLRSISPSLLTNLLAWTQTLAGWGEGRKRRMRDGKRGGRRDGGGAGGRKGWNGGGEGRDNQGGGMKRGREMVEGRGGKPPQRARRRSLPLPKTGRRKDGIIPGGGS